MKDLINEFEKVSYDIDDEDFNINREPVIAFNEAVKVATQFIEKAISQTQKEAYEKGRLETIKEIEEKFQELEDDLCDSRGSNKKLDDAFLVVEKILKEVKSILNQLKS
jgi:hypothetical protein